MFRKNVYLIPPAYEFTNLGKISVRALEFSLFNEVQEPLLLKKLLKLKLHRRKMNEYRILLDFDICTPGSARLKPY